MPGVVVYLTFTLIHGGIITHSYITCKLQLKQSGKVPQRLSDRVRLLKKGVGGKVRSVRGKKLACHNRFDAPDRLGIPALEYDEER